jgi:hypothetical protein
MIADYIQSRSSRPLSLSGDYFYRLSRDAIDIRADADLLVVVDCLD